MHAVEQMAIRTKDGGTMNCYVAKPGETPAPAIIIIQEIFGITPFLKATADKWAEMGFYAVVPDLFWRLEPGLSLSDKEPKKLEKAFKLFGEFDKDQGIEDLKDTIAFLKDHRSVNGKIGCVGYCLGGLMAYLMACRSSVDCSVGYYGVSIEKFLGESKEIKKPLLLHVAGKDHFTPPEVQDELKKGLSSKAEIQIYPEMDHAFCRIGGENYSEENAKLANQRSADFFKANLK